MFSYANSVTYYFMMFAMLGLANYGGREIAKIRSDKTKLSFCFSGIYYAQLISSSMVIIIYMIYMIVINDAMSKIYFINVLSVLLDINWLYFGLEKFEITLKRNFYVKLMSTISIFLFIKKPDDVYLYALIVVLSSLLGNLLLWLNRLGEIFFVVVPRDIVLKHLRSNLTLFLPILLTSVYRVMDKIMLKWMTNYSQVGFYENADKLGQVPLFLISSLSQIMIPRISFLLSNNKKDDTSIYLYKSITLISLLSTTVIFGIMSVTNEFVPLYFGEGYDSCKGLALVILPSYIFTGYASTIRSQILIPYGRDKEFGISLAIGAVCNTVLNLVMIPILSALGAAIATAATEIVVCVVTVFFAKSEISIRYILKNNIKYYVFGAIMFGVLTVFSYPFSGILLLVLKVFLGILVYGICLVVDYSLIRKK